MKRIYILLIVSVVVIASLAVWLSIAIRKITSQQDVISTQEEKLEAQEREIAVLKESNAQFEKKIAALEEISHRLYQLKTSPSSYSYPSSLPILHGRGTGTGANGVAVAVYRPASCDYFILENSSGYIVAEWMGGNDPDAGDKITGDFNSFGTHDFYNQTKDSESNLWIDDYMLSKDEVTEKLKDECN